MGLMRTGHACGDLRMPDNHFEGVSEDGYVSRWKQLANLDLGDLRLPVILGFQTYRTTPSKELGSGWILPLLDASIVQKDEKSFEMVQPDGWRVLFWRDGQNSNILHGSNLALAEIRGDTITVNSTCGSGWKMVFTQGKITSLSKGNHTLTIQRDGMGRGVAVRDGITPVMTLEQDQVTGLAKSIQIGDQRYQLGYDGKPRIESIGGQKLVGGVEPSLHEIIYPDGKKETFDFAVTQKMLPNLKITDTEGKERMIVWGTDGKILQGGEWSYDIKPGSDPKGNAAIGRTNPQKQKEYWFRDEADGKETTVALDGTKTERSWFTSGPAYGKKRKVVQIAAGGVKKVLEQNSYDENGRVLREINKNNESLSTALYEYNERGNVKKITHGNGKIELYDYRSKTTVVHYYKDNKLMLSEEFDNGIVTSRDIPGIRREYYIYDAKNVLKKIEISPAKIYNNLTLNIENQSNNPQ